MGVMGERQSIDFRRSAGVPLAVIKGPRGRGRHFTVLVKIDGTYFSEDGLLPLQPASRTERCLESRTTVLKGKQGKTTTTTKPNWPSTNYKQC